MAKKSNSSAKHTTPLLNLKVRRKINNSSLNSSLLSPSSKIALDISTINGVFNSNYQINKTIIPVIISKLSNIPGIKIDDIRLTDLMFPAYYCNGIYIFYDKDHILLSLPEVQNYIQKRSQGSAQNINHDIVYIGKAGGRSFIERISAHFASREDDYMNNMLKNMAKIMYGIGKTTKVTDNDIDKVFPFARELYLKVIVFPANNPILAQIIKDLEEVLIKNPFFSKPVLNR